MSASSACRISPPGSTNTASRVGLGELGAGNNNTGWLTALDKTLAYAQASHLQVTYWAGGAMDRPVSLRR